MIRSTVHDLPSIDSYDQFAISGFTTLESPYLRSLDTRNKNGTRSMVQLFPLINGCDPVRISHFATLGVSLPSFSQYPK
jgi:hypothetical protein